MELTRFELALPPTPRRTMLGEWYLRGFADAYGAHWAVTPDGPAGDEYMKGYALGVAAVRSEFLAITGNLFQTPSERRLASVLNPAY
jgi:hypothetical protein